MSAIFGSFVAATTKEEQVPVSRWKKGSALLCKIRDHIVGKVQKYSLAADQFVSRA